MYARLGWYGNGDQLRAYHTWLLIPRSGDSTYASWKRSTWAMEHNISLERIPATSTEVMICGTSASSSRAKPERASDDSRSGK